MTDQRVLCMRSAVSQVDLLGFSIGGFISQTLTLRHSKMVRRPMLVGTGPRGGETSKDPNYARYAASTDPSTGESGIDAFLYLFSLVPRTGRAFWEQRHLRKNDVDRPSLVRAN